MAGETKNPDVKKEDEAQFKTELSPKQIEDIQRKAFEKVQAEIVAAKKKELEEQLVAQYREDAGLSKPGFGNHLDELVTFIPDIPDNGAEYIQINFNKRYYRGHQYTVPRAVFNDVAFICHRLQLQEKAEKGQKVYANRTQPYSLSLSATSGGLSGHIPSGALN